MSPKEKTKKELELALKRIRLGRPQVVSSERKLSISAVAEEAGVSPALIHNSHPEIASEIRQIGGKVGRTKVKDEKQDQKLKDLAEELKNKNEMIRKLAIENLSLSEENRKLSQLLKSAAKLSSVQKQK